ncbi:hypothetical protein ACQCVP_20530 [Rossellomorea vietnamensis]
MTSMKLTVKHLNRFHNVKREADSFSLPSQIGGSPGLSFFIGCFGEIYGCFERNRFPLQADDSAGRAVSLLGCACGVSPVPLVPQEIVRLPLQSFYLKGDKGENTFYRNRSGAVHLLGLTEYKAVILKSYYKIATKFTN